MKTFLPILTLQGFFKCFHPQLLVCCVQLIFIIQYPISKNIFACQLSVQNTITLHVMNKYV